MQGIRFVPKVGRGNDGAKCQTGLFEKVTKWGEYQGAAVGAFGDMVTVVDPLTVVPVIKAVISVSTEEVTVEARTTEKVVVILPPTVNPDKVVLVVELDVVVEVVVVTTEVEVVPPNVPPWDEVTIIEASVRLP